MFWKVEFRAAMPVPFLGVRIASIGVGDGQRAGGNAGVGYLPTDGEGAADTPMVFVAIVLLRAFGIVASLAAIRLDRRVLDYVPECTCRIESIS